MTVEVFKGCGGGGLDCGAYATTVHLARLLSPRLTVPMRTALLLLASRRGCSDSPSCTWFIRMTKTLFTADALSWPHWVFPGRDLYAWYIWRRTLRAAGFESRRHGCDTGLKHLMPPQQKTGQVSDFSGINQRRTRLKRDTIKHAGSRIKVRSSAA